MGHNEKRLVNFPDLGWVRVEIGPLSLSYHSTLAYEQEG